MEQFAAQLQQILTELGEVHAKIEALGSSNTLTAVIGLAGVIVGALVTGFFQFWGTRLTIKREEVQRRQSAYDDVRNKVRNATKILQDGGLRWGQSRKETGPFPIQRVNFENARQLIDDAQTEPLIDDKVREALELISVYHEQPDGTDTVSVNPDYVRLFDNVRTALRSGYPWTRW